MGEGNEFYYIPGILARIVPKVGIEDPRAEKGGEENILQMIITTLTILIIYT